MMDLTLFFLLQEFDIRMGRTILEAAHSSQAVVSARQRTVSSMCWSRAAVTIRDAVVRVGAPYSLSSPCGEHFTSEVSPFREF